MRRGIIAISILATLCVLAAPEFVHAQILQGVCSDRNAGCTLKDFDHLIRNMLDWGFAISGALALLLFIIGGTWMIFSAGNASRIERGKDILIGTTLALVIIFGSSIIVDFVLQSFGSEKRLTATCGPNDENKPCGNKKNMICFQRTCVSRCSKFARTQQSAGGPYPESYNWECKLVTASSPCGTINDYQQCGTQGDDTSCIKNLCPEPENNVCCRGF